MKLSDELSLIVGIYKQKTGKSARKWNNDAVSWIWTTAFIEWILLQKLERKKPN
jgi:hypothetical protein